MRVHQHLMQRADLSATERARAQNALAQDYLKAGLFDRAEEAYRALEGTPFETEARLALLQLHERSRDWRSRRDDRGAAGEAPAPARSRSRIAHHHCELALEADARGDAPAAATLLQAAETAAPHAVRPLMQRAQRSTRMGDHDAAWALWSELARRHPEAFARAAGEAVAAAMAAKQTRAAGQTLAALFDQQPGIDLLRALATLEGVPAGASPRLMTLLREQPSLSAVLEVLDTPAAAWPDGGASICARRGGPGRAVTAALPLCRLRLRGAAPLLAMPGLPRLGHLSTAAHRGAVARRAARGRQRASKRLPVKRSSTSNGEVCGVSRSSGCSMKVCSIMNWPLITACSTWSL